YRGRQVNQKLHNNIAVLLQAGKSYGDIVELLGCSRSTISIVRKQSKASG
ncbi:MAG: helix-turn-helix domain-containing protein, partial [Proteobacteria bacterium]|nr:helix-turn-helix domain-containing protein [Pseudomonadota bacterium]